MLVEGANKGEEVDLSQMDDSSLPAAITDTGCERDLNEDRYAVVECDSGVVWIVCDGMGGQSGGELAAQLAIDAIRRDLQNMSRRAPEAALKSSILEANRIIVLRRQNQAFANMGTTIVSAIFYGPEVALAHVGDSRAYLIRDGAIQQLTTDHTYVQSLVDAGQIQAEEALSHPQAHILTRCIGSEPGLDVSMSKYWLWDAADGEERDRLILCSDGLYSLISEGEIASVATEHPPQQACVRLVELAKERGGFDNITIAIIPLSGQLHKEPPVGYEEQRRRRQERERLRQQAVFKSGSLIRSVGVLFVLTCLAILITILIVAFLVRAG